MREVDLIVTKTKKMGVVEDMHQIKRYRMQEVTPILGGAPEGVIPMDAVDYEAYDIKKFVIDGKERYVAMDSGADGIMNDLIENNRCLYQDLAHGRHVNNSLRVQLDAEYKYSRKAWETYNQNISYIRKASFLVRLKFLLTGRMY